MAYYRLHSRLHSALHDILCIPPLYHSSESGSQTKCSDMTQPWNPEARVVRAKSTRSSSNRSRYNKRRQVRPIPETPMKRYTLCRGTIFRKVWGYTDSHRSSPPRNPALQEKLIPTIQDLKKERMRSAASCLWALHPAWRALESDGSRFQLTV